ncbi:hypothetical protein [Govanella unica]|uniref:Porin n=1 Tax=Govanella unica TaxID=2975056 RepID=A0A9X3TV66_9PROT|nr:hypothetical protein [Govania unica]MDA5192448.1 hypothetical protein [Govania unica]
MSSVRTIGILTVLGIALAMPGFALADGSTGKSRAATKAAVDGPKAEAKSKFIYLDDGSGGNDDHSALRNVPARSMFRLDGERPVTDSNSLGLKLSSRPALVLDPQNAPALGAGIRVDGFGVTADQRSTLQISTGSKKSKSGRDNFGVWVTSESSRAGNQSIDLALEPAAKRPNYTVGVNVGYHGFTFGASLLREQNGLDLSYQGYDLGVGYFGRSWFTNLQVAGFRNDSNPLYYNFMGDRFRAVELGAGYIIWPGFTFSGRFKYFDYGNPPFLNNRANEEQHIFSLDTRLNF